MPAHLPALSCAAASKSRAMASMSRTSITRTAERAQSSMGCMFVGVVDCMDQMLGGAAPKVTQEIAMSLLQKKCTELNFLPAQWGVAL